MISGEPPPKEESMKKKCPFRLINISTIAIMGFIIFGSPILYGQEGHPFYLDLFRKGERAFLAENYIDAVKQLEIAIFGSLGGSKLRVKAYIYLSLSHYYLKNIKESDKYLKDIVNLIGNEEFKSLEVSEFIWSELQKLLNYFILI